MEASYFYFLILPLVITVTVLVASVYYYAHREEIAKRKTKKLVQAYIKEKAAQKKGMAKELAKIDRLFEEKSKNIVINRRLTQINADY